MKILQKTKKRNSSKSSPKLMKIYTVGHSTRSLNEFLEILKHFNIQLVIDVRRWPSSKKFPWFNKENLANVLADNNIEYLHYPELGGYRKEGYANFSKSDEFAEALNRLVKIIDNKIAAIMCAELLWFRCHRRYIAQSLVKCGHNVIHIFDKEKTQEHKLSEREINEKMSLVIWCDKKVRKMKKIR